MKNINVIIRTIDYRVINLLVRKTKLKADIFDLDFNDDFINVNNIKNDMIAFVSNEYNLYENMLADEFKDIGLKRFIKVMKYINNSNDYKKTVTEVKKFELFISALAEYSLDFKK